LRHPKHHPSQKIFRKDRVSQRSVLLSRGPTVWSVSRSRYYNFLIFFRCVIRSFEVAQVTFTHTKNDLEYFIPILLKLPAFDSLATSVPASALNMTTLQAKRAAAAYSNSVGLPV
jgi:hypothetical protein